MSLDPYTQPATNRQPPNAASAYRFPTNPPRTLEEMHAAWKAGRARMNAGIVLVLPPPPPEPEPEPEPPPAPPEPPPPPKIAIPPPITEEEAFERSRFADAALRPFPEFIGPMSQLRGPYTPSVGLIQSLVANHYGITRVDMLGPRRKAVFIKPRHIAMYLARKLTKHSLPELGHHFGGRDHTTVLSAIRKISSQVDIDDVLAKELEALAAEAREPR